MPGRKAKNFGTIDLTRDEYNIITVQKVVELCRCYDGNQAHDRRGAAEP